MKRPPAIPPEPPVEWSPTDRAARYHERAAAFQARSDYWGRRATWAARVSVTFALISACLWLVVIFHAVFG